MKTYPIEKYKFYTTKTKDGRMKTIATSTYAGKTVRGVAICDHEDTYNEEVGKKIAAARCAVKVAEKRYFRAASKAEAAWSGASESAGGLVWSRPRMLNA